jgi:hypothetical protein
MHPAAACRVCPEISQCVSARAQAAACCHCCVVARWATCQAGNTYVCYPITSLCWCPADTYIVYITIIVSKFSPCDYCAIFLSLTSSSINHASGDLLPPTWLHACWIADDALRLLPPPAHVYIYVQFPAHSSPYMQRHRDTECSRLNSPNFYHCTLCAPVV